MSGATAMVAALALAAAPFRAAQLEVPGALEQVEIPETMQALGVPVRVRAVRSKLKPQALIDHFRQAFEKAGLFVPDDGELRSAGNLVQVTGLDVLHRNSVSVLLQPNLDGTTTVVVGEALLHAAKKEAAAAFAPLFPGATALLVADLEIGKSLSYTAKAKATEVTDFYRETLSSAGYRQVAEGEFERAGTRLRIWLKPREGSELGVVIVRSASR